MSGFNPESASENAGEVRCLVFALLTPMEERTTYQKALLQVINTPLNLVLV